MKNIGLRCANPTYALCIPTQERGNENEKIKDRGLQNRSYKLKFPQKSGKEKLPNPAALAGIKKIQHHAYIGILTGNFFDFFQCHFM